MGTLLWQGKPGALDIPAPQMNITVHFRTSTAYVHLVFLLFSDISGADPGYFFKVPHISAKSKLDFVNFLSTFYGVRRPGTHGSRAASPSCLRRLLLEEELRHILG